MAVHVKSRREGDRVYFVINRYISPTNVCVLSCAFCGFARKKGEDGAFEYTVEDIVGMVGAEVREVHIVGGHHPDWPFEYYERVIAALHAARPEVQIKAFTAAEIDYFWRRSRIEPKDALTRLKAAGLQTMPGGGAEIFSARVAKRLRYTGKADAERWCEIHGIAHALGIKTNATMLYGHVETLAERVDHLLRLREQQDASGGFVTFIPLAYQVAATKLVARQTPPADSLKTIAVSRLLLDNFPHVEAYWVTLGEETTSVALHFGADDVNGTLEDERIQHLSGAQTRPLLELGARASEARFARWPEKVVTFVIDSNPNYTNVCITDCQFCAFYRKPGDREAWTLTVDEVLAKVDSAASKGATTVLLQGGHNPALPLDYYLTLVRETRKRFPQVTPHFFTASEIHTMAQVAGLPFTDILDRLWDAGQRTIPGGGAEVLSTRVRSRIAPKKGGPEAWLEVHREAHRRGFKSTATMMYGHVETVDDLLDHFDAIRELQDMFGGFTAFVPWSFKPGNTLLEKWIKHYKGPNLYLRVLAAARLYLDNFPHVQASWFSEGKPTGQIALHFGADDWGGTLFEENVHRAAEYVNTISVDEIVTLIREADFTPTQKTTQYQIVRRY